MEPFPAPCSIPGLFGTPGLRDGWEVAFERKEGSQTSTEYFWKRMNNRVEVAYKLPPGVDPRPRKWVQVDDGNSRKYWTNGLINRLEPPNAVELQAEEFAEAASSSSDMPYAKPQQLSCSTEDVDSRGEDDWEKVEDVDGTLWYYSARDDQWSRHKTVN